MRKLFYLFIGFVVVAFSSCKKDEVSSDPNAIIVLSITLRDSLTHLPIAGEPILSYTSSSEYGSRAYSIEKNVLTDSNGVAILKFETDDEKYLYRKCANEGSFRIAAGSDRYSPVYVGLQQLLRMKNSLSLISYPKFILDFTNVTGDFLNDSLIFTYSHNSSPQSGGGWYTMYSKKTIGADFLSQPIVLYNRYLNTYYFLKYELRTHPGGILLVSDGLPVTPIGTEIHIPVEF